MQFIDLVDYIPPKNQELLKKIIFFLIIENSLKKYTDFNQGKHFKS